MQLPYLFTDQKKSGKSSSKKLVEKKKPKDFQISQNELDDIKKMQNIDFLKQFKMKIKTKEMSVGIKDEDLSESESGEESEAGRDYSPMNETTPKHLESDQ